MVGSISGGGLSAGNYQKRQTPAASDASANTAFYDLFAPLAGTDAASANSDPAGNAFQLSTVQADFSQWLAQYNNGSAGANSKHTMNGEATAFEQLMQKASAQGGYQDPQAFLQSLSPSELTTLQHIHSLADPVNPASLTKEGALNLLTPPNDLQDIDHDGFEMVGVAKTWQFPPVDAPASVKAAWEKTTANLNGPDKTLLMMSFSPGVSVDGAKTNAYISPDADYSQLAAKAIEGLQFSLPYNQAPQAANMNKQIALLQDFIGNLQAASS